MKLRRLWVALSIVTILIPLVLVSGCAGKDGKGKKGKGSKNTNGSNQTTD